MEDYTRIQTMGIFDESTEEFPVARVVEWPRVASILYLKDGRYILRTSASTFDLYDRDDQLIRTIPLQGQMVFTDKYKDTRVLIYDPKTYLDYMLDVEEGLKKMEFVIRDYGNIEFLTFGKDINTLFWYDGWRKTTVGRLDYREGKWHSNPGIKLVEVGAIEGALFDGEKTLFVSIGLEDSKILYSLNTSTGETKELCKFNQKAHLKFVKMLTPSILVLGLDGFELSIFDASKGVLTNLGLSTRSACFTPDGRRRVAQLAGWNLRMYAISDDGQKMYKFTSFNGPIAELRLSAPMLHPLSTCLYGNHHWIRLMSDGTVETSKTWPALGIPRQEIRLKDVEPEAKLAVIVWGALVDVMDTFEKMKRVYLRELVRAIAKEMIPSIK